MIGFIKGLFASKKGVDTALGIIDKGVKGLDMLVFTDEEKAKFNVEMMKQINDAVAKARDENSIRSVTRRWLACAIIGMDIFLTMYSLLFYSLSIAKKWKGGEDIATFSLDLLKYWGTGTTCIIIFYFGYYAINSMIKAKKGE